MSEGKSMLAFSEMLMIVYGNGYRAGEWIKIQRSFFSLYSVDLPIWWTTLVLNYMIYQHK